jgi:DNA-binding NarL/FixJ family response regulator
MRILIAEDEALMRSGLALVLAGNGLDVVGEAGDADTLVLLAEELQPDVVITDIRMPPTHTDDGVRAALTIRDRQPHVGVLVLSQHVQRRYALELVGERPEGVGYLLKQRVSNTDEFCADVRRVAAGGTVLDPEVVALMVNRARRDHATVEALTLRQQEVLGLIAEGRSNAAIARKLRITDKAVVQHISHIYDQLGLGMSDDDHRRVLAVIHYLAN